jgi:hypothetical protein
MKRLALIAGILLSSSTALAEPFVMSLTQHAEEIHEILSCTDVLVDMPRDQIAQLRKDAQTQGVKVSEMSCAEIHHRKPITEECVYHTFVNDYKFSYIFHSYIKSNGSAKKQCLDLNGIYVKGK